MLLISSLILLITLLTVIYLRLSVLGWTLTFGLVLLIVTILFSSSLVYSIFCWLLFVVAVLIVYVRSLRFLILTQPFFSRFKKILPPMSQTEREALDAGDVWWEADLFRGAPDWKKMHRIIKPELSLEEQAFLDHEVEELCSLLNDWRIVHVDRDLSPEVWSYLKVNRFFGMAINKKYGGRGFSAFAHSCVIAKIASRSYSAAVNTMVPNSLGPGELLQHYGTEEQKNYYLPRLASGEDIPCFALTSTAVGSDATAMIDRGIVCRALHEGREVLGIRLNFEKRYITLAPVATVIGLAFKLYDPEKLLGTQESLGITVALLPAQHPGVTIGARHFPSNMAFMNGPIEGKEVFIPLDWIVGGPSMVGKGWRMLMECLSIGRSISLPALSTGASMLSFRTLGAYAYLRRQFKLPIGHFAGVQAPMARVGGFSYMIEACRRMTAGATDLGIRPSVASAIAKYHCSEYSRQILNDSMDIHAGRAIQLGPRNYLGNSYFGIPVGITVEGANILTRNLIIFGQGAIRCHPYVLLEMQAAVEDNIEEFDQHFLSHIGYTLNNAVRAWVAGLTGARFIIVPRSSLSYYYRQLTRMSAALAVLADFAMLVLGGELKRQENLSARLGDLLSALYLASSVLKYHADENSPEEDLPYVQWCLETCLFNAQVAIDGFLQNFVHRGLAFFLRRLIFPWGKSYCPPSDELQAKMAKYMMRSSGLRDRLTYLCYVGNAHDPVGRVEHAFQLKLMSDLLETKLKKAIRDRLLSASLDQKTLLAEAVKIHVLTQSEAELLEASYIAHQEALRVDVFEKL